MCKLQLAQAAQGIKGPRSRDVTPCGPHVEHDTANKSDRCPLSWASAEAVSSLGYTRCTHVCCSSCSCHMQPLSCHEKHACSPQRPHGPIQSLKPHDFRIREPHGLASLCCPQQQICRAGHAAHRQPAPEPSTSCSTLVGHHRCRAGVIASLVTRCFRLKRGQVSQGPQTKTKYAVMMELVPLLLAGI